MAKNQTNKEDFSKYIKTFWKLFLCCIIGVIFLFLFASWGFFGEMPSFEKLENPDQMIDFQTEYTKELHSLSDYPKIDFELIRKHFKEWEHHKVEDIMTYRNKSFSSPVTGSVAPVHHTPWETAMDDSLKTFLNK